MKNLNWLVKKIFYKHHDKNANPLVLTHPQSFDCSYQDQVHANLCTDASENMINHFYGKPISSLTENPRGIIESKLQDESTYPSIRCGCIDTLKQRIEQGPLILALPLHYGVWHSVVAIGFADNGIIYHDPLTGPNKYISNDKLLEICKGTIEFSTPRDYQHAKTIQKGIQTIQNTLIPKDFTQYNKFFTVNKMADPKSAVLSILDSYVDSIRVFNFKSHRQTVKSFLNGINRDKISLTDLLSKMNDELRTTAKLTHGGLERRINAAIFFNAFSAERHPKLTTATPQKLAYRLPYNTDL